MDRLALRGKHPRELFRKALDVRIKPHPLALVIDHVEQVVLKHVDGFLQTVEHEAVRVEAALAKAVEHGRTLIKRGFPAAEDAAGAAGLVALFNNGHA
ncbi:hypothetical protein SDC9_174815 [bioreactor metagenome]|uniref:Uncharacterized protein n=1 Tax=bioreactor metagenome TaxID=1076179 RepID=A0A645GTM3_9ZZZZ